MDLCVLPECYADTMLLETLVPPKRGYNHQKGCGTVARRMKEKFKDSFALGIIDKDKKHLDYLNEFTVICDKSPLTLYRHQNVPHYIIQIAPAIETFILTCAQLANISLSSYGLPDTLKELTKVTKTVNSQNNASFKGLYKAIKASDIEVIQRLRFWISHIKDNVYNVDINALCNF